MDNSHCVSFYSDSSTMKASPSHTYLYENHIDNLIKHDAQVYIILKITIFCGLQSDFNFIQNRFACSY